MPGSLSSRTRRALPAFPRMPGRSSPPTRSPQERKAGALRFTSRPTCPSCSTRMTARFARPSTEPSRPEPPNSTAASTTTPRSSVKSSGFAVKRRLFWALPTMRSRRLPPRWPIPLPKSSPFFVISPPAPSPLPKRTWRPFVPLLLMSSTSPTCSRGIRPMLPKSCVRPATATPIRR